MKLIRASKERLLFRLGKHEKELLFQLVRLYPRMPAAHQPLSKAGPLPNQAESQRLLDEALGEQRVENKKQLERLLADPARLAQNDTGWRLSLSSPEFEWLLQVLNDIRVGSWVMLGSPAERFEIVNQKTAPHLWAMEMAGLFQMEFLQAVGEPDSER